MIRPKKAFAPRKRIKPGSPVYYRELRLNLRKTIANIPIPESAIEKPGFSGHQQK
jgi:hypothetical protein